MAGGNIDATLAEPRACAKCGQTKAAPSFRCSADYYHRNCRACRRKAYRGGECILDFDRAREVIRQRVEIEEHGFSTPCWVWQGPKKQGGYGRNAIAGYSRRQTAIHRASYTVFVGPIPEGLQIDHLCRVRACCNPDHLEPVTGAENVRRAYLRRNETAAARVKSSGGVERENSHDGQLGTQQFKQRFTSTGPNNAGQGPN